MGRNNSENWFFISLNSPFTVLPDAQTESQAESESCVAGTVTIRLTKPAKVKSLSLSFTGVAKTCFHFDSSSITGATPCIPSDQNTYRCTLVDRNQTFIASQKVPHILPAGTHEFPFSIPISESLPAVVSSSQIKISYELSASLQLTTLLPFMSSLTATKPVILLQRDELPSDSLFNTAVIRVKSRESSRLSTQVSLPCSVLPAGGTIPLIINLLLRGNATTVSKITFEMMESIYTRQTSDSGEVVETLIEERLVTKQNCPPHDWPSSTTEEPTMIPKRLMFKVPQLPLSTWTKETSWLASLDKGFCHASGTYANANLRVAHSIRVQVGVRGLTDDADAYLVEDFGESEVNIWIVGNQEYREDETNPPTYYRSFSTTLVDGDKICEIDQQAFDALQDDPLFSALPPCYDDVMEGSSSSLSSPSFSPIRDTFQLTMDHLSR